jgi:hypothetical protein
VELLRAHPTRVMRARKRTLTCFGSDASLHFFHLEWKTFLPLPQETHTRSTYQGTMDGTYRWDIFHQKDGLTTVLVGRHLNYDIRYDVEEQIVTKRVHEFHIEQIHPCVSMCRDGKCVQDLCQLTDTDFKSAADSFDPWDYLKDPIVGKLVQIAQTGAITFVDQDGGDNQQDLNWRRLRNLARPIVDEQLSKLAISGDWKTSKVKLHLGNLMIDNTIV